MTQNTEKPSKKSKSSYMMMEVSDSSNTNTLVKNCDSCKYNPVPRISIDDAPPVCWDCVGAMNHYKFPYPFWTPKDEESTD